MTRSLGTHPHVTDMSWAYRRPLKFQIGDEKADSLVACASAVSLNDDGRRLLPAGTLLNKITSGAHTGMHGPYDPTKSNGQQTLTAGTSYVLVESHDVTYGDKPVAGYFMDCVFDVTQVADSGAAGTPISKHGAALTALKAAFPQCVFQ